MTTRSTRPVYVFDDGLTSLSPLTDLRAAFDVRTGVFTTIERFIRAAELDPIGLFVPDALAAITRERHKLPVNIVPERTPAIFAVNGRWALPRESALAALRECNTVLVDEPSGRILAAMLRTELLPALLQGDTSQFKLIKSEPLSRGGLIDRPWHARSIRDKAIEFDLSMLIGGSPGRVLPPVASVAPTARIHASAILDHENGHIHIADHAVIRPGAILIGPCAIGPYSTVLERAVIRPNTVLGPYCKAAGEVSGTIFQGYSNKSHDGFLGDSWLGEWVNLGAGTTNSNLLNTYGEVIAVAAPGGSFERTGEQFLGAMIGDHVKTAICTRIMTGAVIHTGAMIAQTAAVTGCVEPLAWCTDEGVKKYRLGKFIEVLKAAMGRRGVAPSEAYLARVAELIAESASLQD